MNDHPNSQNPNETRPAGMVQGADDPLAHPSYPLVTPGSPEEQIKLALRQVFDPEIGLEVVQLGLIREIILDSEPAEIKMMLTTPFCPYGGWLIQQIKDVSESVSGRKIKITVLPDLWSPEHMEDPGLLAGW
ncbi:MAG: metal-sulfur cluster assembly factor [Chloroflexi bacterium]|nr:metal-sulfur cluster assembly factor [Chloroflexota bacterium]